VVQALKVSSKSNPNSVAGALAGALRDAGAVEIQVVGAGALNQAIKALAIARSYLAGSGVDLTCRPTFADVEIEGEGRTAIRLQVDACAPGHAGGPPAVSPAAGEPPAGGHWDPSRPPPGHPP
jgi:stage V sporulation protein S